MYEGHATDKCFDILAYWDISDMGYRNGCHCYVPHVHTKQICYRKGFYKIKEYMKNWNDEQKKAIIDINDLKQLTEKRGFPLSERKNQKVSINPEYYINKKNIENLSPEIVAGSFKNYPQR